MCLSLVAVGNILLIFFIARLSFLWLERINAVIIEKMETYLPCTDIRLLTHLHKGNFCLTVFKERQLSEV